MSTSRRLIGSSASSFCIFITKCSFFHSDLFFDSQFGHSLTLRPIPISLLLSLFRYKNKHSNILLNFSKRTISLSYSKAWFIIGTQLILIYCYLSTYLFIDLFISWEWVLCLCGCLSTTCAKQHRNPGILLQNIFDLCPTLNDG